MLSIASPFAGVVGLVLLVLAAASFYKGGRLLLLAGSLFRTDTRDALEAGNADGPIDLVGTARPYEKTLTSPFDHADCLAYDYRISERVGDGHVEQDSGRRGVPFLLEDETGAILVDPAEADLQLVTGTTFGASEGGAKRVETDGSGGPRWEFEDADRRDHGDSYAKYLDMQPTAHRNAQRRHRERRLDVGETVHVQGPVDTDGSGARTAGAVSGAIRGTDGDVVISDTTKRQTMIRKTLGGAFMLGFGGAILFAAVSIATAGF